MKIAVFYDATLTSHLESVKGKVRPRTGHEVPERE